MEHDNILQMALREYLTQTIRSRQLREWCCGLLIGGGRGGGGVEEKRNCGFWSLNPAIAL